MAHPNTNQAALSIKPHARCLLACLPLRRYVIHTAGVVSLNAPQRLAYSRVIEPTLHGIENVLSAVNKTASVEKGGQLGSRLSCHPASLPPMQAANTAQQSSHRPQCHADN